MRFTNTIPMTRRLLMTILINRQSTLRKMVNCQITVNHSHWITGMSIEGHKERIISKNTAKDERTSEFEVSKLNGKVDGKIDVYIDEKVNGKPFKYDHHYNITYKFNGPTDVAGANAPGKDDKILLQVDKGSDGATTGQSESNSSNKDKVENP